MKQTRFQQTINFQDSKLNKEDTAEVTLEGSFVQNEKQTMEGNLEKHMCSLCDKTFKYKQSLKRHIMSHDSTKIPCKKCTLFFHTELAYQEHKAKKHRKTHLCSVCGNVFKSKGNLAFHIQVKHEERKFKCHFEGCDKSFVKKEMFDDHVNAHTGKKPHGCTGCEKKFHSRYIRNEHQAVCTGRKTFQCITCNVFFCSRNSLSKHNDAQHKDRVYRCKICGNTYKYRSGLTKHMKSNHPR